MKILNLYAGIGGNRKLWGDNHAMAKAYGYNLSDLKEIDVRKALRNAVRPQDGLFIFQKIMGR